MDEQRTADTNADITFAMTVKGEEVKKGAVALTYTAANDTNIASWAVTTNADSVRVFKGDTISSGTQNGTTWTENATYATLANNDTYTVVMEMGGKTRTEIVKVSVAGKVTTNALTSLKIKGQEIIVDDLKTSGSSPVSIPSVTISVAENESDAKILSWAGDSGVRVEVTDAKSSGLATSGNGPLTAGSYSGVTLKVTSEETSTGKTERTVTITSLEVVANNATITVAEPDGGYATYWDVSESDEPGIDYEVTAPAGATLEIVSEALKVTKGSDIDTVTSAISEADGTITFTGTRASADPVTCVVGVENAKPKYHAILNVGSTSGNLQIFLTPALGTAIYGADSGTLYEHDEFFMVADLEALDISPRDVTFTLESVTYTGSSFAKAGTYPGTVGYGIAGLHGNYSDIDSSNEMYGAGFVKIFVGKPFPNDISNVSWSYTDTDVDEKVMIRGLDIFSVAGTFNTATP